MRDLYNLIITITNFPELYLGIPSVQRLYAYIGGYLHEDDVKNADCLDGFNEYVLGRFKISTDHNWASVIEFVCGGSLNEIDLFKQLFEDFKKQGGSSRS